jgi:hypothetical protein
MEAVVAAPGAVRAGLVVVDGVRPARPAAGPAEGAGAAAASMGRRPVGPSTLAGATGVFFAGAAGGLLLSPPAGLFVGALAVR